MTGKHISTRFGVDRKSASASVVLRAALLSLLLLSTAAFGEDGGFAGARWIAMEADSTVLFPHIHLLKKKSQEGQSLKPYALPVFSKQFELGKSPVSKATAFVCGLGQYELFVNGQRVGHYFLDPGWTMYDKRLLYNEHDVTSALLPPTATPGGLQSPSRLVSVEVMLGGGMYDIPLQGYHKFAGSCGAPKLLFALHVVYGDGSRQTIVSDDTWTAKESPVRYSSIFAGETCDATFEGTPRPVCLTAPHWPAPLVKQDDHTRLIVKRELPMTRITPNSQLLTPHSQLLTLYDMGQNCSGIVRLTVKGRRGSTVTLRPAEILKDGGVYQRCAPGYTWTYILSGDADGETWQPQFTYTGFRYVEVKADEGVEIVRLTGLHTSADVPVTGRFECSDTLLNRIFTLIDWAVSSNLASITTDCPTREKLGWQEQNHLMAYSMMYRYDMQSLMRKIADDLADSQHADGAIPTIAPEYTVFQQGSGFEDTPEWGASFILCPYYSYLWYGDDLPMRRHYDAMKRYIGYLQGRSKGGLLDYGLGDWYDVGPARPGYAQLTSVALTATAMYHYELCVMARMATLMGKTGDAHRFSGMAAAVKQAFNARFWDGERWQYERGSQTASAMALFMGLTTDANRDAVLQSLVGDITTRLDSVETLTSRPSPSATQQSQPPQPLPPVVTAGDVGYRYVLQALREGGRSDVVWRMNSRDDIPGYAYQLRQGATALTESWQAYADVSNNHLMLGHLMEWLFQAPGGIRQAEGGVAWKRIIIDPQMVGGLTWANTSFQSPQGLVACHWTASPDRREWTLRVTIPDGSEADVHLPDGTVKQVRGGEWSFASAPVGQKHTQ